MGKAGNTIVVAVGILLGLVTGMLFAWLGINLIANIPEGLTIVLFVYLVLFFVFFLTGMWSYARHQVVGTWLMSSAILVLIFVLIFYLPIFTEYGIFNLSTWFWW